MPSIDFPSAVFHFPRNFNGFAGKLVKSWEPKCEQWMAMGDENGGGRVERVTSELGDVDSAGKLNEVGVGLHDTAMHREV